MTPADRLHFARRRELFVTAMLMGSAPAGAQALADEEQWPLVLPRDIVARSTADLQAIRKRGELRVLVSFDKTEFFMHGATLLGFQAEALQHYEKFLNRGLKRRERRVALVYLPVAFERLIPALRDGYGDVAAAPLTVTPEREREVDFVVDDRLRVDEVIVTHKDEQGLASLENLSGRRVYVLRATSFVEHLRALNERLVAGGRAPVIIEEADPHLRIDDVLELVNAGIVAITVADDYKAELYAKVLPDLVVRQDLRLNEGGRMGWAVRKGNPELKRHLQSFERLIGEGTAIGNTLRRRYDRTYWLRNPVSQNERRKLARLIGLFEKYGRRYGFDWLAIAAQAYQESGLDHSVRSRVGAVGVMQVLPSTAADMGIDDVHSLEGNIHAGVRYLAWLRDNYFDDPALQVEDRVAFAWAAYNAGPGRVIAMRRRSARMGLDRNRWFDHVEYAGLAMVGQETVRYVSNIFKYYVAYTRLKTIEGLRAESNEARPGAVR